MHRTRQPIERAVAVISGLPIQHLSFPPVRPPILRPARPRSYDTLIPPPPPFDTLLRAWVTQVPTLPMARRILTVIAPTIAPTDPFRVPPHVLPVFRWLVVLADALIRPPDPWQYLPRRDHATVQRRIRQRSSSFRIPESIHPWAAWILIQHGETHPMLIRALLRDPIAVATAIVVLDLDPQLIIRQVVTPDHAATALEAGLMDDSVGALVATDPYHWMRAWYAGWSYPQWTWCYPDPHPASDLFVADGWSESQLR